MTCCWWVELDDVLYRPAWPPAQHVARPALRVTWLRQSGPCARGNVEHLRHDNIGKRRRRSGLKSVLRSVRARQGKASWAWPSHTSSSTTSSSSRRQSKVSSALYSDWLSLIVGRSCSELDDDVLCLDCAACRQSTLHASRRQQLQVTYTVHVLSCQL